MAGERAGECSGTRPHAGQRGDVRWHAWTTQHAPRHRPAPSPATHTDTESGFMATRVDELVNWGRKNSLWPMPLGLSCCGIELMAMIGPKFDISRFGAEAARFSPRQCDLMIVAGTLVWKMAEACRVIYDQMPDPKWVIAMGVCSSSGGIYD